MPLRNLEKERIFPRKFSRKRNPSQVGEVRRKPSYLVHFWGLGSFKGQEQLGPWNFFQKPCTFC